MFFFILLGFSHLAFAQEATIETTVCTRDADGNGALEGSIVIAQFGNMDPVAGTTAANGCVALSLNTTLPTDIENETPLPGGFEVGAPYPNPVERIVQVPLHLEEAQSVEISLFDVTGRTVVPAYSVYAPAGRHDVSMELDGLVAGLYVYRIAGARGVSSGKIVKIKGGNGESPRISLSAGSGALDRVAAASAGSNASASTFAVRFDAAKQGYQLAREERDIDNGEVVILTLEKLAPGVPSAPLLSAPANNAVGLSENSVTLTWAGDELAEDYSIQVSTAEDFSSVEFQKEQMANTSTAVTGLNAATMYFWRVRASGPDGTSEWSLIYRFSTADGMTPAPGIPNLQSPQNGAANVALPEIAFNWGAASNASQYRIQIATSESFATPVIDVSGLGSTAFTATTLGNDTQYFWRVSASGEGGTSDWSNAYSFTTASDGGSQAAPVLQSPANGATNVETSVDLTWNAASGATSYAVQVSPNANFSTLAIDASGLGSTSYMATGLNAGATYYWRAQADGPDGASAWSMTFSFTTASNTGGAPPAPGLLAPADGATGIAAGSVGFSWSAAEGADTYDVQLSKAASFASVEQEETGITGTSVVLSGLTENATYYWRARSAGMGGTGDWSEANSFGTAGGGSTNEMIALDLMGPNDTYYGLSGGLVDNGVPTVTPTDGKIVIIAISMSNGFQEFERFIELYENHPDVKGQIELVNCAVGGNALERWVGNEGADLWAGCKNNVTKKHSLNQVKVVWAKNADQFTEAGITLPDPQADYYNLVTNIGLLGQKIGEEFPSVQAVFNSSRIYGGYVEEKKQAARGEPISYEGGFAINTVIEKWKRGELPGSPWMGWGPYIWANALTPNGSGIFWDRTDFQGMNGENQHPSADGAKKVADALHNHFMQFDWYRN